jgi:hypothetical protein
VGAAAAGARLVLQDGGAGRVATVTVPTTNNQLLRCILERRHPEYRERVEDSGAVDIHVLMKNLNAGRQRVAVENAERDAEQKAHPRDRHSDV